MAGADDYAKFNAQREGLKASAAASVIRSLRETNPDAKAKATSIAGVLGIPDQIYEVDPQHFDAMLEERFNKELLRRSPMLTSTILSDPYIASVAHDDLQNLSMLEGVMNAFSRAGLGVERQAAVNLRNEAMQRQADKGLTFGEIYQTERQAKALTPEALRPFVPFDAIAAIGRWKDARMSEMFMGDETGTAIALNERANEMDAAIASTATTARAGNARATFDASYERRVTDDANIVEKGGAAVAAMSDAFSEDPIGTAEFLIYSLIESSPIVAGTVAVGVATRNPVAAEAFAFTASSSYEQAEASIQYLGERGYDLTKPGELERLLKDPAMMRDANARAAISGMIVGGFDALSLQIAGVQLTRGGMREVVAQTAVQAGLGAGGAVAGRTAAGLEADGREVLLEALLEAAAAPLDAVAEGRNILRDNRAAEDAQARRDMFAAISDSAQKSKLRGRMPKAYAAFVDQVTKSGPIATLYVPAKQFVEYFQSAGVDPEMVASSLNITPEALASAVDAGGDISFATATYAEKVAGSKHDGFFMDNMKVSPGEMTMAEAKEFFAKKPELLAEAQAEAERARVEGESEQTVANRVFERIRSGIIAAGRTKSEGETNAVIWASAVTALSQRAGMNPEQLLDRIGLPRIEGAISPVAEDLATEPDLPAVLNELRAAVAPAPVEGADPAAQIDMAPAAPADARLAAIKEYLDEIGADLSMSDEEIAALIEGDVSAEDSPGRRYMQRVLRENNRSPELRRSLDELQAFALEQSSWRDWYERYQAVLEDIFGDDTQLIRKLLAATSQAASVPANVGLAIKAYEQMLSGAPFEGYLPAVIKNLERIRAEVELSGQKIGEYGKANEGDSDGIAIDRHLAMIMFDTVSPTAAQVEAGKNAVREIAARLGWQPRQVQAALWAANIKRTGKEPQSYDTYLLKKADQIRGIRDRFPAPVAGRGGAGDGAGGGADTGAAEGGAGTTFFQSARQPPDTSVAGGLTSKSFIRTRDLLGSSVIPIFADLTSAGNVFDKLDGMPIAPTAYMGGPNFPWLKSFRDSNIVWAFNDKGKITALANHVRALRDQAVREGRDPRVVVTVLAMKDDAHTSNEMTINALLRTLDAVVDAGRFPQGLLATAKDMIVKQATKADDGYSHLESFPGFGSGAALAEWTRKVPFTARKALAREMQSAAFQQLQGMFPVARIVREAVDPDYRATQVGDALLAFEIDPDDAGLIVDFDDPANEAAGIPRHPAYRYGMRGKLVGSFSTHIPMEVLYGDLLPEVISKAAEGSSPKFLMERLSNGAQATLKAKADGTTTFKMPTATATTDRTSVVLGGKTLQRGTDFTVTTEVRKSSSGKDVKEAFLTLNSPLNKGDEIEVIISPQGQTITPDIVREAEVIEGLHDYRVAQAYTAGIAGQWRSSDNNANKGGIQPVEFERALAENEAAVTLTQYTRDDVKAGQKDGSLRVFQLGTAAVKDGGLNIWMAVKKGADYREIYPSELTDKLVADGVLTDSEVALVGVASNELGVSGMATFQVLKGVEEGVTVLDAFKVKSPSKPHGLLPSIYATLGFEEVGEIPFDPQYFTADQLADLKAVWSRQGWNEADGYPSVAIMKWRGDDAARSEATRRFVKESLEGLGFGANEDVGAVEAATAGVLDSDGLGDQGDGVTGQGDGRADPRRFADRARDVSGRARDFVENLLKADDRAITALKLPRELIDKIRSQYGEPQGLTLNQPPVTTRTGDVLQRTPELQEAARRVAAGEMTAEEYTALVDRVKPVTPYAEVPDPATLEDMQRALTSDKLERIGAPDQLEAGTKVGLRLDIPAYAKHGVWVVSVHEQQGGFAAGPSIGYTSVARASSATMGVVEKAALAIAQGKPKGTIATIKGDWVPTTPEEAKALAEAALSDPAWRQVGMDPERASFFYDRETMQPITAADEVIQIGPLVLAKNPTYAETGGFLFQNMAGTARGSISLPAGGLGKGETIIRLFATADLSTFMHESGHFFLAALQVLAADPQATPEIQSMYDTVKNWWADNAAAVAADGQKVTGTKVTADDVLAALVNGTTGDRAKDLAIDVGMQEQWARGFELYLMEGKAPSAELRSVFERMAEWLKLIYRSALGLNVKITPELRSVFDRMLATDEQMQAAQEEMSDAPLFESAEQAGMTPEEFKTLLRLHEEARGQMMADLLEQTMEPIRRQRMQSWKEERAKVEGEVRKDVASRPVYAAIAALRFGRGPSGDPIDPPLKLSRDAIEQAYPDIKLGQLPGATKGGKGHRYAAFSTDEGGMHPDIVATMFGYQTGRELLIDLATAPDMEAVVKAETDAIMAERYPDPMTDGTIADEAIKALHNDARAAALERELAALTKMAGEGKAMTAKEARAVAQASLKAMPVKSAGKPAAFLAAERRAAREAIRLARLVGKQGVRAADARQAVRSEARAAVRDGEVTDPMGMADTFDASNAAVETTTYTTQTKAGEVTATRRGYNDNLAALVAAKRQQLLNHMLYSEARKIEAQVDSVRTKLSKLNKADAKLSKAREINHVKAARAIAAKFGLARGDSSFDFAMWVEQLAIDDPLTVSAMVAAIDTYGQDAKPYEELTVLQFRAVADAINSVLEVGKALKKAEIDGKAADRDAIIAELTTIAASRKKGRELGETRRLTKGEQRNIRLLSFRASLIRVEAWARDMDDGKIGPFNRFIVKPVQDALGRYRDDRVVRLQQLLDILNPRRKELLGSPISAPELTNADGEPYTFENKGELLHAILHTGNDSNMQKLLIGRGWSAGFINRKPKMTASGKPSVNRQGVPILDRGVLDTSKWDAFMARMYREGVITKEDIDTVTKIWRLMDDTKRPAQTAHKRIYGYYFGEIEPRMVDTPWGPVKGGYVPAIGDRLASPDAGRRQAEAAMEANPGTSMFPTTGSGFTKGRVEQYQTPLELNLMLLPSHLDKVLRFTHLEPIIRQTASIVNDKGFRSAMMKVDPKLVDVMVIPWLQRAASQTVETRPANDGDWQHWRLWRNIRRRAGISTMFANVVNTAQQITGLSTAALLVKPSRLASATVSFLGSPLQTRETVMASSAYMRNRMGSQSQDLSRLIEEAVVKPTTAAEIEAFFIKHGYFLQTAFQNVIDPIVWTASYDQSVAKGMTHEEAVFEADSVVRRTQSDIQPENVSSFEAGTPFARLFTMFYSYFNAQVNLVGGELVTAIRTLGWSGAPRYTFIYLFGIAIPAIAAEAIVQASRGELGDEDDDGWEDDLIGLFLGSQLRYLTAFLPFVGNIANAAMGPFTEAFYDDRISTSPAVSFVERATRAPYSTVQAVQDPDKIGRAVGDTATLLALLLGIPAGQFSKTTGFLFDTSTGKQDPETPLDVTRGLITGRSGT